MKKIGLVGGMTPDSTVAYYETIIELGRERLEGVLQNPVVIIYSLNLAELARHQGAGRPDKVIELLVHVLESLRRAGAEVGALTANTPHVYFDELRARTALPLVSIVDATVDRALGSGASRALLLGTETTMGSDMYRERLARGGIELVVPEADDRQFLDRVIYDELSVARIRPEARARTLEICSRHIDRDRVDTVILGCTELPLILSRDDLPVTVIDTARVHAEAIFAKASQ